MVKHLLYILLLWFALPVKLVLSAQLIFIVEKATLEFGHYSKAEIYAVGLSQKISHIDFSELEHSFGIVIEETIEQVEDARWPDQSVQLMEIKLYPRTIGALTVSALRLGDVQSKLQSIMVIPGVDDKNNSISQQVTLSSSSVWQRQRVTILVEIVTRDPFVSLQADELTIKGFDVFAIPASVEKMQNKTGHYFTLRIGWVIFPLIDGVYGISLPAIEYSQFSQTLRSYFFPAQELNVTLLPPYIPPTMPVGEVRINSELQVDSLLYPDTLSFWDIRIEGLDVSPNWIPHLLPQLKVSQQTSSNAIKFYNASSQYKTNATQEVLRSQLVHHVPFKPVSSGRVNFPLLHTQYFDPDSGKIVSVEHRPADIIALSVTWRIVIASLLAIILMWLGRRVYVKLKLMFQRSRLRRLAWQDIRQARSILELRQCLHGVAKAEAWSDNMTLQNWQLHWQQTYKSGDALTTLIKQLSEACYRADSSIEFVAFQAALIMELRRK